MKGNHILDELNLLNSNLDLSVLDNLSPEQRELALSILQEYAQTGDSEAYSKLILEDYAETPVDILTFVDDYNYLGNAWHDAEGNSKLYPYWRKELVKIFPDNFTTTVNNGIFSGSRGRGKTEVALLIASYLLHRILCLKDPIAYYHLKPTEKLVFAFMNIKLALAEEIGVSKFQNTLQSSPWFMAHGELEGRTKKIWVPQKYNNQVAIDIKIGSQADDLVGLPIFFCLSGDTPILTDRGTYDIKSLENKIIRVPSVDDTGHIILSDECTVKQTAECDIEYSLELENGAIIKCTPTHRFKLTDGSYKEARYLTEEDELFDIAPYGYIYKTINLLNGKIYVGQHKGTIFDKGYLGSGQLLSKALQKYGREAFEIELLAWAPDKTTLDALEKYYIKYYSCPENKIKKSSAHRGARNYMYNKGYLRIGGANTNAKKFYCIDDRRFECRKDLLNYLRINLYANITPNILRNIEKENYTQYIKKHFPYLIQNLTWGYKNEN